MEKKGEIAVKLLDRYLMGQFSKNLLLVLSSLIAIYLLVDFFERVDNFLEAKKSVGLAVQYLFLKVPLMYEQLIPVCILLAGIITLGVLNHHHELMALKAGGISVTRVIRPLLLASVIFTIITIALGQWVLPRTISATNRIWYEEVNRQVPRGITREGRTYYRGEKGIFTFIRPDMKKEIFTDFTFASWDAEHQLKLLLTADNASWQNGTWHFENGQVKKRLENGEFHTELFSNFTQEFTEKPADFFLPTYKQQEKSLGELFAGAWSKKFTRHSDLIEFHKRLSYIFLGFPLLILGIPVLLAMHKTRGRDLALAIPISCGMAFAAWGFWSATQSMANAAYLPPALASWSIHLLAAIAGMIFIRRHNQ